MPRKYRFALDPALPEEVKADFPEHLEAGPVTINQRIAEFVHVNPTLEITEDPDDYILHVRAAKPPKQAQSRAR